MSCNHPSQSHFKLEILDLPWSHQDSEYLRRLQREEIHATYGRPDSEPGTPPSADDISIFVVAYLYTSPSSNTDDYVSSGVPIACGALRALPQGEHAPGDVEIKRMYVHQDYRGRPWSAAQAVLAALEERARGRGWTRVVLETGSLQTAAIKFYQREGYTEIPKFGVYAQSALSLCFGKTLPADRECGHV
ncbi:hypothetical protein BDV59DRAFT_47733 [Aspergillus ambiguus]|uniref:GNAT family N-acetyltransferase n=1 Tax=Aspergillus ambiguus TaxID=176160 RepID=UPI003CCDE137